MAAATELQYRSPSAAAPALEEADPLRARTWSLLASLLRQPPEPTMLGALGASDSAAASDARPLAVAWRGLRDAALTADAAAVDDEFHDLFIGLGRGELVPYASWYRTGFLMNRPLVALRRDLAMLGFVRSPEVREPEDHASAVAEVMAMLADPAGAHDASTQALFFREHVDGWMPALFADLRNARSADFYVAVATLGEAFVDFERTWLDTSAGSRVSRT